MSWATITTYADTNDIPYALWDRDYNLIAFAAEGQIYFNCQYQPEPQPPTDIVPPAVKDDILQLIEIADEAVKADMLELDTAQSNITEWLDQVVPTTT